MAIGKQPQPTTSEQEREEVRRRFQINSNAISYDYFNEGTATIMDSKTLLNKPGFRLADSPFSKEKLRTRILTTIKKFPSYSEHMRSQGKIKGIGPADFLNERGKHIVKRLDEIAKEIKSIDNLENPKVLENLLALLEESKELIYEEK